MWSFSSGVPIYPQIVERVVQAILSGELKPGEKLPSVRELAVDASVNPNTMQRAMAELEALGLVITYRTAGRTVSEDMTAIENARKKTADGEVERFLSAMNRLGYTKQQAVELAKSGEEN